jgi:hypothetical protein
MKLLAYAIVVCACAGGSLSATTLVPADFAQMVRESELIVRGTVVHIDGQRTGARQTIESLITLRVTDTMKGTAGEETVFRVPGGKVGPYRRVMVGAPEFATGDEVILFLKGRAPAIAMPYGLSQGVYRVSRAGGASVVTPAVVAGFGRVTRGDPARRPIDPMAFTRQVEAALTQSALAPAPRPAPLPAPPDGRRAIPRPR